MGSRILAMYALQSTTLIISKAKLSGVLHLGGAEAEVSGYTKGVLEIYL
jgi:hypothetical protein